MKAYTSYGEVRQDMYASGPTAENARSKKNMMRHFCSLRP
jgi:hypothetical protein